MIGTGEMGEGGGGCTNYNWLLAPVAAKENDFKDMPVIEFNTSSANVTRR